MNQTSNRKASKRTTIVLLAFMVFGLSLSSLINFHLFRIYGSPLNTELIQSKREELTSPNISHVAITDLAHAIIPVNHGIPEISVTILHLEDFCESLPQNSLSAKVIYSLRAPPIA